MSLTQTGTKLLQNQNNEEVYFRAFQRLLKAKNQIDKDILTVQKAILRAISSKKSISSGIKYVPRMRNTNTLIVAIKECMIPNKEMTMGDILKSLSKHKRYQTQSTYLYTMVNNKIHADEDISPISRGIFVYKKPQKLQGVGTA